MNRAEEVQKTMVKCLYDDSTTKEAPKDAIIVEGLIRKFGFDPKKIEAHKEKIKELLTGFPDNFYSGKGGGWTFLNFCADKNGEQWAEHPTMEELICLGIATKMVRYPLPREFWDSLPGGVPYVEINLEGFKDERKEKEKGDVDHSV